MANLLHQLQLSEKVDYGLVSRWLWYLVLHTDILCLQHVRAVRVGTYETDLSAVLRVKRIYSVISMNFVDVEGGLNAIQVRHTEVHEYEFVGANRCGIVAAAADVLYEIEALPYHFYSIKPSYRYV